jgi:hypothetical protein
MIETFNNPERTKSSEGFSRDPISGNSESVSRNSKTLIKKSFADFSPHSAIR